MTSVLKKKRGREKILHLSMQDRIFIATGNNQLFFSLLLRRILLIFTDLVLGQLSPSCHTSHDVFLHMLSERE